MKCRVIVFVLNTDYLWLLFNAYKGFYIGLKNAYCRGEY